MARSICLVALALFACAAVVSAQDVDIEEDVSASLQRNNGACSATSVSAAIAAALANTASLSNFRLLVEAAGADLGSQRTKEAKWTIFAPVNAAAGTAGGLDDAERIRLIGGNRAELLEVVRRHIATGGALPTKALEKRNNAVLATAQTANPAVTLTVVVARTPGATPPTTITIVGPTNRVNVVAPTNTHACKSIVHAVNLIIA